MSHTVMLLIAKSNLADVIAPYMGVFFVAFVVSFVVTPWMRWLARRHDIVDHPDAQRKIHREAVPYLGGIAIFAGWIAGVMVSFMLVGHYQFHLFQTVSFPMTVVLGAAVILVTGVLDDMYHLSPRVKIGGQLFAAAALASQNVGMRLVELLVRAVQSSLASLPLPETLLAWIATPLPYPLIYVLGTLVIALFVIGGCNAMNLLDGMDGLAAGVTAIACVGFLLIAAILSLDSLALMAENGSLADALVRNDAIRLVMCLAIMGAVLGFLPFNFNPASIFMGDAGSLLLGFLCAATMLMFALVDDSKTLIAVTASLIVFAVPITDTSLAIFRRKMQGLPLSAPDDRHLHHLLRRKGLSVRQTVLVLYGMATMFATLGVLLVAMDVRWRYVLAVAMVLYAFIFVYAYKVGHGYQLDRAGQAAGDAGSVGSTRDKPMRTNPLKDTPPSPTQHP